MIDNLQVIITDQRDFHNFLPDLSHLQIGSIISELPMHKARVSKNTLGSVVAEMFSKHPDMPGVAVQDNDHSAAVVSRRKFYETLGKPFGIEILLRRPISIMLDKVYPNPLIVNSSMDINDAARLALLRSNEEVFEPIGVLSPAGDIYLIDVHILFLAQSHVLGLTNALVRKQKETAEILHQAGVELTSVINTNEMIQIIFGYLEKMCNFGIGLIYILEHGYLRIIGKGGKVNIPNEELVGRQYPSQRGFFPVIQQSLKPIVLSRENVKRTEKESVFWFRECASILIVPLVSSGVVIGMFTLQTTEGNGFTNDESEQILTFANQAASTLQNALLFEEEKRRTQELSALNKATSSLIATLEPSELLYKILLSAVDAITNIQHGILYVYDNTTQQFFVGCSYQFDDRRLGDYIYEFEKQWINQAILNKGALVIKEPATDLAIDIRPGFKGDTRSIVMMPLVDDAGKLGVLCLLSSNENAFSKNEIQLLEVFCSSATAAIRNSRLHSEVQQMAVTDPLTGLLNRRGFYRQAMREVERAHRYQHSLCVIMVDIDHFKKVNDTYGHDVGDKVIFEVGRMCRAVLRSTDICCRFGGEEFVILLPETSLMDARQVAERLRVDIYKTAINAKQSLISITVSLGVAQFTGVDKDFVRGLELLLNHADYSLYTSKTGGRNMVTIYTGIDSHEESAPAMLGDIYEFSQLAEVLQRRESELKWIEAARQATQEQLASILQNASEAIISVNVSYNILLFNYGAEMMFGYTTDEVIGKPLGLILPEHQLAFSLSTATDYDTYRTSLSGRVNLLGRRKDGFEFPVEASHSAFGLNGQRIHTIILNDITERKLAEERIITKNLELSQAYDETIEGWAHALELRDLETHGHSKRVVNMVLKLADALCFQESDKIQIRRGALLHDIGKISIPDHILLKDGPLNESEWNVMKRHPTIAYELLSPIAFLRPALDIPRFHHEHWDGGGYPLGLVGNDIPLAARLFTITDVWDALRSERPYRRAWSEERCIKYINEESGKLFDPEIVKLFFDCRINSKKYLSRED